jgi:hypothetical protein
MPIARAAFLTPPYWSRRAWNRARSESFSRSLEDRPRLSSEMAALHWPQYGLFGLVLDNAVEFFGRKNMAGETTWF